MEIEEEEMVAGSSAPIKAMALLAPGVALALFVSTACGGEVAGTVQAPWPTATVPAHPVSLADVHCWSCHNPQTSSAVPLSSASSQEAMPHPLEQREDCLICHSTRAPFPFSQSHDLALNQACLICHTPSQVQR